MGGAAGVLAGYPLDTVKVRIQTSPAGTYKGTFDCLFDCVRKEGVGGLYRGMTSPLLGVAGINAVTFGVNAQVLKQLPQPDSISSITIAGASAGLIQTSIVSPMELVKTQMQVGINRSDPLDISPKTILRSVAKRTSLAQCRTSPEQLALAASSGGSESQRLERFPRSQSTSAPMK